MQKVKNWPQQPSSRTMTIGIPTKLQRQLSQPSETIGLATKNPLPEPINKF